MKYCNQNRIQWVTYSKSLQQQKLIKAPACLKYKSLPIKIELKQYDSEHSQGW